MIGDWMAAVILVAFVYVLVRPESRARAALDSITDGLVALITTATKQGE